MYSPCEICERIPEDCSIYVSAFGVPKYIQEKISIRSGLNTILVPKKVDNPKYRTYNVCSSDINLVKKIIKENGVEVQDAVMAAKIFRINNPIRVMSER